MRHLNISTWARQNVTWLCAALLAFAALVLTPASAVAQVEYYATDAVGSTRVVFNAAGEVVARSDYLPFGEALGATGSLPAQRFTGQERDGEAGLDNFNAREFDPGTARFTRLDPAGGDAMVPQTWNRYAYARNDPLGFNDPSGMTERTANLPSWWTSDMIAGGGAYYGTQYATRIGERPTDLESRLNGTTAGYQGGDLESAQQAWGVIMSLGSISSINVLGATVGLAYIGGMSLEERADAGVRLNAAANLINDSADKLNPADQAAIRAIKAVQVTSSHELEGAYMGNGTMRLSIGYLRHEGTDTPWLASVFAHEGQHAYNTGLFTGDRAWEDEFWARATQLRAGQALGFSEKQSIYIVGLMSDPAEMQRHMVKNTGMRR